LSDAAVVDNYLQDWLAMMEPDAEAHLGIERWSRAYSGGRTMSLDALSKDIDLEF
jgi:hypothetical protein